MRIVQTVTSLTAALAFASDSSRRSPGGAVSGHDWVVDRGWAAGIDRLVTKQCGPICRCDTLSVIAVPKPIHSGGTVNFPGKGGTFPFALLLMGCMVVRA